MAKILPGLAVNKISGTIAGTTFQNWRGMLIARKKPTPTNVMSPRQTVIRSVMTLLSRAWRDELNVGLRKAWNQRAKTYPWLDVFGNEVKMSGENLYIKQNFVLLDNGLTRQDTPVPDIVPAELGALETTLSPGEMSVEIPGFEAGYITAQSPFIDVKVAGGFLEVEPYAPPDAVVRTQALPAGRKHQKSDFRHAVYVPDIDIITEPHISLHIAIPTGEIRNVVVIIQRYNKYGNFTAPVLVEGIAGT